MKSFLTIDEVYDYLEKICEEVPENIFKSLNGGVILSEDLKYHEASISKKPLYILGEYVKDYMGRTIFIYYGSLKEALKYEDEEVILKKLREVLHHEFIHHIEDLAGEKDLKIEDKVFLDKYKASID